MIISAAGEWPVEKYIKIAMHDRNGRPEPHFLLIWEGDTFESWNPCRFTAHANPVSYFHCHSNSVPIFVN